MGEVQLGPGPICGEDLGGIASNGQYQAAAVDERQRPLALRGSHGSGQLGVSGDQGFDHDPSSAPQTAKPGAAELSVDELAEPRTASLRLAFWLSRRPPSRRFTYGFGRAEDVAGVFIVILIAASAVFAGWEVVSRLLNPATVDHVGWVAAAAVIGFVGNEIVAVYRIRVGNLIRSAALVAVGMHARPMG